MPKAVKRLWWDAYLPPAFITLITIPFTYSIAHGIGFGFLTYLLLLLVQRRWREINPLLVLVSLLFALSFALR